MFKLQFCYHNFPTKEEFIFVKQLNFIPTQNMVLKFSNQENGIKIVHIVYMEEYDTFIVGYDFH